MSTRSHGVKLTMLCALLYFTVFTMTMLLRVAPLPNRIAVKVEHGTYVHDLVEHLELWLF